MPNPKLNPSPEIDRYPRTFAPFLGDQKDSNPTGPGVNTDEYYYPSLSRLFPDGGFRASTDHIAEAFTEVDRERVRQYFATASIATTFLEDGPMRTPSISETASHFGIDERFIREWTMLRHLGPPSRARFVLAPFRNS